MMLRSLLTFCAIFVLAAMLTGCVPSEVDSQPESPSEIAIVAGPAPFTLMPYSTLTSARQVGSLVFAGLMRPDGEGVPVPDLAEEVPTVANGRLSPDASWAEYTIRQEAEWHDGQPVTAADVLFTWDLMREGTIVDRPGDTLRIAEVTAVDDRTVRVEFTAPSADLAFRFMPYVLPRHVLADSPDVLSDPFWEAPFGSGPYRVKEKDGEALVRLTPVGAGEPLSVFFAPTEQDALGTFDDADAAVWLSSPVDPAGASEYVSAAPSTTWSVFLFNAEDGRATSDSDVRRILSSTFEIEEPGMPGPWGQTAYESVSSTEAAGAALDAKGWLVGGDGMREKDGQRLEVLIRTKPYSDTLERDRLIEIREALVSMGVDARVSGGADLRYGSIQDKSRLVLGDFDIAWTEITANEWTIEGLPVYGEPPSFRVPYGPNLAVNRDPGLEQVVREYLASSDPQALIDAREGIGTELDRLALTVWDKQIPNRVLAKSVRGVDPASDPTWSLLGAEDWEIDR